MSESRFLALESETAATALSKSLTDFAQSAANAANPKLWAKEHPWATVGVGLLGALTLARVAIPRRKKGEGGRWRDYFKQPEEEKEERPAKKSWVKLLIHEALAVARPAIMSAVAASIGSRASHHSQGNGHSADVR